MFSKQKTMKEKKKNLQYQEERKNMIKKKCGKPFTEERGITPNSFYQAIITLLPIQKEKTTDQYSSST